MSDVSQTGQDQPSADVAVHGRLLGVSGGVEVNAQHDVNIDGDVVGRDKIEHIEVASGGTVVTKGGVLANLRVPRTVQLALGVVALAVVALTIKALTPVTAKVNTEFIFDASAAMADPERWTIAQTVFGDQATYATRREQLALRKVGGGCDVPHDPLVPLGANQADRLVSAVKALKPEGDAALVDAIKAAADDLPADADAQNTLILVSAGQDSCLTKQQKDPCTAMSAVADSLKRAGIKFTLHIVALRANETARQQLVCLARASANGYVYQANSVADLKEVLGQIERGNQPAQIAVSWPSLPAHEIPRPSYGLGWSADGNQLLTNTDQDLWSFDLKSGQAVTLPVKNAIAAAWSPDGKHLAYTGAYGYIYIWGQDSTTVLKSDVEGKYSGAYSLAWSPDGQKIAAGSLDGTVPLWDIASKTAKRLAGHTGAVSVVAWSLDGKRVASGGSDKTIRVWDAASGQSIAMWATPAALSGLAWSPDSQQLAANDGYHDLRIWDVSTGQAIATVKSEYGVGSLRWSPTGEYVATSNGEIIETQHWQSLGRVIGPAQQQATSITWSPDGTRLAIGSRLIQTGATHYYVQVWDVPKVAH